MNSAINTTIEQATETWNILALNHASNIPHTSEIAPAIVLLVASNIAGKVITESVTYGT